MTVILANLGNNIVKELNNFTNSTSFYCDSENQTILCKDDEFSFLTKNLHLQYFVNYPISLQSLLDRKGVLIEKWDIIFKEAIELSKEPILLFGESASNIFMIVNESFMTALQFYYGRFSNYYIDYCDQQYDSTHYWILKFSDFLNFVDLDGLKTFLNSL